jgi:acyl-CoA thioester hydrolase
MPLVTSVEFRVRYGETDQMGVVYHPNYLAWVEIGRTEHMRVLGTSYRDIERGGIMLAVTEASVRYIAAARYDDRIRVDTTLVSAASRSLTFDYVVFNADTDERLATARTVLVSIDAAGRVTSMPRALRDALSSAL